MTNTIVFWLGIIGLTVGVVLYFVLLPHVEGPSLSEQQADQKEWLVQCPNCNRWKLRLPTTSDLNRVDFDHTTDSYKNWYHCFDCDHRWHEEYKSDS